MSVCSIPYIETLKLQRDAVASAQDTTIFIYITVADTYIVTVFLHVSLANTYVCIL